MGIIAAIAVAVSLMFAPAQSSAMEQDAWESLSAHGTAQAVETPCQPADSVYVDSGEHGTTQAGQYSVWSITDENIFHHFTCK